MIVQTMLVTMRQCAGPIGLASLEAVRLGARKFRDADVAGGRAP